MEEIDVVIDSHFVKILDSILTSKKAKRDKAIKLAEEAPVFE
jgi:hypothetical protein